MTHDVNAQIALAIRNLSERLLETRSRYSKHTNAERWSSMLMAGAELLPGIGHARWEAEVHPVIAPLAQAWDNEMRGVPRAWYSAELIAAHAPLVALCRIISISYDDPLSADPAALAALLASPHLGSIHTLDLLSISLPGDRLDALLAHKLSGLTSLNLYGCELGDAEIARMVAHEALWTGLRHVDLSQNKLRAAGAQALADCPHLAGLETLKLGNNPLGNAGRVALGLSPHLSQRAKSSARAIAAPAAAAPVSDAGARDVFGDVRSILQQPPSAHGWALLCDRVDRIDPERARQEAIPYAAQSMSAWPAALRPLPKVWLDQLAAGQAPPAGAQLARALVVDGKLLSAQRAALLATWAQQTGIAHLKVQGSSPSLKGLQALFAQPLPALRALELDCTLPDNLLTSGALERAELTLRELMLCGVPTMYDAEEEIKRLRSWEALSQLETFTLRSGSSRNNALRWLAESPWWRALRSLTLEQIPLSAIDQRALLGRGDDPGWTRLEQLTMPMLPAQGITSSELADLAQRMPTLQSLTFDVGEGEALWNVLSSPWPALREIIMFSLPTDEEYGRRLTTWELPTLRRLRVESYARSHAALGRSSPETLLRSPATAQLEALHLDYGALDGARAPAVMALLPTTLVELDLRNNPLGPEGARALASRDLPLLRSLTLHDVVIPREGMDALYAASWWPQLEHLELVQPYGEGALETMAGRLPPGLKTLILRRAELSDDRWRALLQAGLPTSLESITLAQSSLSTKGLKALCDQLPSTPRLHTLDLRYNTLTAKSIEPLLTSPQLTQLAILELDGNRLGFTGKERLMTSPATPLYAKGAI
jgi:hypothetical protein